MLQHWEKLLHYACLAPSGHNTQPWKFRVEEDRITIFPDTERQLRVADPTQRELYISLGCALENLCIAAAEHGYEPIEYLHIGREPHIEVFLPHRALPAHNPLFDQIGQRRTTRSRYDGRAIPTADLELLRAEAGREDVSLRLITNSDLVEELALLTESATERLFSNKAYVEELSNWLRFNKGAAAAAGDGIYSAVAGKPPVPQWLGRMLVGGVLDAGSESRKAAAELRSASAVAVFVAARSDIKAWVNVGRSFERMALAASALGIALAPESSLCTDERAQRRLHKLLQPGEGEQVALVVRLGYAEPRAQSYRRPLEEVVEHFVPTIA